MFNWMGVHVICHTISLKGGECPVMTQGLGLEASFHWKHQFTVWICLHFNDWIFLDWLSKMHFEFKHRDRRWVAPSQTAPSLRPHQTQASCFCHGAPEPPETCTWPPFPHSSAHSWGSLLFASWFTLLASSFRSNWTPLTQLRIRHIFWS